MSRSTRIAIIGTGYVGMACVVGFAELGHTVVGYDIAPERVRQLQCGRTPYREAGISEALGRHLSTRQARFVDDFEQAVSGASFIVVAVGTPAGEDGSADLSAVEDVVRRLSQADVRGAMVVIRSTVPPGTSERIADQLRGRTAVVCAPEFLREGSALTDFLAPDRVVIGAESAATAASYAALFSHLNCPVLTMSYRDAEIAKGMSNAFLAMKISFANQVANLCDGLGADALDVLRAVGLDRRIGECFLHPGIGFGGPCFEKDLKSLIHLSKQNNADYDLLAATLDVNDRQRGRVFEVLQEEFGAVAGLKIGVWGLAFKGGTDDLRNSLAVRIVEDLVARGAEVVAYDPSYQHSSRVKTPCGLAASAAEAANADVLVVLTDWDQFRALDPATFAHRLKSRLVVDGRNILDADAICAAGLRYRGIGRRKGAVAALKLAKAG